MDRFVQELNLFKNVPPNLLVSLFPKKYSKGELIFNEGEKPEAAFLVKSGLVKTMRYTSQDEPSTVDFILPGQMFGLIAVMDNKNYPVSAVSVRTAEIYRLDAEFFHDCMNRSGDFRKEVFRQVGNHLRNSQALRTLMQESVDRRIAHILTYLFETMGPEIQLLREDIAAMAGCTESTAIRTIIGFRKKKIIQTGWKKFKVIDSQKLKALLS